jgi:hypothetical protein
VVSVGEVVDGPVGALRVGDDLGADRVEFAVRGSGGGRGVEDDRGGLFPGDDLPVLAEQAGDLLLAVGGVAGGGSQRGVTELDTEAELGAGVLGGVDSERPAQGDLVDVGCRGRADGLEPEPVPAAWPGSRAGVDEIDQPWDVALRRVGAGVDRRPGEQLRGMGRQRGEHFDGSELSTAAENWVLVLALIS